MSQLRVSTERLRRIVLIALFGAISYVLMLFVHFPVMFLTLDLKDAVIALCGLYFGPLSALTLSVLVPLLEFVTVSDTGVYGLVMNFLGSATFSVTASLIYKYKKSLWGAIAGLFSAVAATVAVMVAFNLLVTPYYMGVAVAEVQALIPVLLLPFNVVKAVFNAAMVLLFYKPISGVMQRAGVLPRSSHPYRFDLRSCLIMLAALALIALSLVVIIVVLHGKITLGLK